VVPRVSILSKPVAINVSNLGIHFIWVRCVARPVRHNL
jgi:hypothetical protein